MHLTKYEAEKVKNPEDLAGQVKENDDFTLSKFIVDMYRAGLWASLSIEKNNAMH